MENKKIKIDRLIIQLKEMIDSEKEEKQIKVVQQTLNVLLKKYLKEKQ